MLSPNLENSALRDAPGSLHQYVDNNSLAEDSLFVSNSKHQYHTRNATSREMKNRSALDNDKLGTPSYSIEQMSTELPSLNSYSKRGTLESDRTRVHHAI